MKRYVVSGIPLCEKVTGIPRVMFEILSRLDQKMEEEKDIEIYLCYPKEMKRTFAGRNFSNIKLAGIEKGKKKWTPQVVIPFAKKMGAVVCEMGNGFCLKKGTIARLDDVRPAVGRYDSFWTRAVFKTTLLSVRKNAEVIVTVSESQKKSIQRLLPEKKVIVISNGWNHMERFESDDSIFQKYPMIQKGNYYYSLGSVAKHKNYQWIYEAARRNQEKQFVIAGNEELQKWGTDTRELQIQNIVYVGYVSDDENKALYQNCKAYLHPAFYEGFGIPPLEAVSQGCDIAVSDIPEFREVYGDKVSRFHPYDYDFDLDSIKHLEDDDRREILNRYSWEDSASKWLELLKHYKTDRTGKR